MKSTDGLKVGDTVEMSRDWGHLGRPKGSRQKIIEIHKYSIVKLQNVSAEYEHDGRFHACNFELAKTLVFSPKDFYERY